jgi:putative YhdH/YhfP family quinone oxidoreductase
MASYRALSVNRTNETVYCDQVMLDSDNLPMADLLIEVKYSALNYFDALVMSGAFDVEYPITPGLDAAGIVVQSNSGQFQEGDEVIVNGSGLGVTLHGGLGGYIAVNADMAIALPVGLSMQTAMTLGTAGIATAIGVMDFMNSGVLPKEHKMAVTGASFGTGAVATAVLSSIGYDVTAYVQDMKETGDYVKRLGAKKCLPIESLYAAKDMKYADAPLYDGVFDIMGGETLACAIKHASNNSTIVVAGYDREPQLATTLYPFLDRGINLMGANAIWCSPQVKRKAWQHLASDWRIPQLEWLCTEVALSEVDDYIKIVLEKKAKGRVIINHKA